MFTTELVNAKYCMLERFVQYSVGVKAAAGTSTCTCMLMRVRTPVTEEWAAPAAVTEEIETVSLHLMARFLVQAATHARAVLVEEAGSAAERVLHYMYINRTNTRLNTY